MKNATLTLLCCCALLTACDKSSDTANDQSSVTDSEKEVTMLDKASSVANDATNAARDASEHVAGELDNALESAKDAADSLADIANENASDAMAAGRDMKDAAVETTVAAVDSVKEASSAAVEKSTEMIAAVSKDDTGTGESIYKSSCVACHGSGVAGAPKLGDIAAWKARIAQGSAVLSQHAIEGYKGNTGYMPAKGGYMNLSDSDVTQAVQYMVSQGQ